MNTDNIKKIMLGASAVAILILAWFFLAGNKDNETSADSSVSSSGAQSSEGEPVLAGAAAAQGREILNLLSDLKTLMLDDTIFADPVFRSLQDFAIELEPEPKGRPNPFAPIGEDVM